MRHEGDFRASKRPSEILKRFEKMSSYDVDSLNRVLGLEPYPEKLKEKRNSDSHGVEFARDGEYLNALLHAKLCHDRSTIDCEKLIDRLGGLSAVFNAPLWQIEAACTELGLNMSATFIRRRLDSAILIEQRTALSRARSGPVANNFQAVVKYLMKCASVLHQEQFRILYLDNSNTILGDCMIPVGSPNSPNVEIRQIMGSVLRAGAHGFILSHNRTGQDTSPSESDATFTRRLESAANVLGVPLFDHIIVADSEWFSFRLAGLLENCGAVPQELMAPL